MVEINEGQGRRAIQLLDAYRFSYILKLSVTQIMEENNPIAQRDSQIRMAVIVVIAYGASDSMAAGDKSGLLRWNLFKRTALEALIDANGGIAIAHDDDIFLAIDIENAGSSTSLSAGTAGDEDAPAVPA